MNGSAKTLRNVPPSIWVFCAIHVVIAILALVSLALSHCVDQPSPPGTYGFDGCSAVRDPWRDGTWPYFLAMPLLFIVSSVLILRAQRFARWVLLLSIVVWFAYVFFDSLVMVKDSLERDQTPGTQRGWGAALTELLRYFTPLPWIVLASWVAFDFWFMFRCSRRYFHKAA
jgi:hypothetical protein